MRDGEGVLDVFVRHIAAQDLSAYPVAAAFEPELDDAASRALQELGRFLVENAGVSVADENEHLYPCIAAEEVLDLGDHLVHGVSSDVTPRAMTTFLVDLYDLVVEAIGTSEGTAP